MILIKVVLLVNFNVILMLLCDLERFVSSVMIGLVVFSDVEVICLFLCSIVIMLC